MAEEACGKTKKSVLVLEGDGTFRDEEGKPDGKERMNHKNETEKRIDVSYDSGASGPVYPPLNPDGCCH